MTTQVSRIIGGCGLLTLLALAGCSSSNNPPASTESAPPPAQVAPAPAPAPPAVAPVEETKEVPRPVVKKAPSKPVSAAVSPITPPAPEPATVPEPPAAVAVRAAEPVPVPLPPPVPVDRQVLIPSGTLVPVVMTDSVDSKTDRQGKTYRATIDSPVLVDGQTILAKGANVVVKLAEVQSAGSLSGRSEVQLRLDRVFVANKAYEVESNAFVSTGNSQGQRTARNAGIGAALGAAIGAIAGGGKGAAIGAGVGAGGGVGATAAGDGQQVRIESETHLVFRLERELEVTVPNAEPAPARGTRAAPARLGEGTK